MQPSIWRGDLVLPKRVSIAEELLSLLKLGRVYGIAAESVRHMLSIQGQHFFRSIAYCGV